MKHFTFSLLFSGLLFLSLSSQAQNFALGIRGGISIPNLSAGGSNENPLNTGYKSSFGPDGGIFAEFRFSNLFSLEPVVEYSSQGGKKDGFQAFPAPAELAPMFPPGQAPTYLYANYNSEAKLGYIMIPVLAKFGFDFKNTPLRIYIDAGPFIGFLVYAKQVTTGESLYYTDPAGQEALPIGEQSFNNTQDIKSQLQSTNFGAEANLGLNYHFAASNIFIEGGGNYGFMNIQKGTANGKNTTGAATAFVGYSYVFGK
jgi:hypothetical protein